MKRILSTSWAFIYIGGKMITNYGYIRVSSKDLNEDRQLLTMQELNIPEANSSRFSLAVLACV